jgi:hypothetical protein
MDVNYPQGHLPGSGEATGISQWRGGTRGVDGGDDRSLRVQVLPDHGDGARGSRRQFQAHGAHQKAEEAAHAAASHHQQVFAGGNIHQKLRGQSVYQAAPDLNPLHFRGRQRHPFVEDGLGGLLQPAA